MHLFLGGGRKREKHWPAKETLISCLSHVPNQRPGPQPRRVPPLGSNWWPCTVQDDAQLSEPCHSGLHSMFNTLLKILLIYFYREGRERERERNINVCLPFACPQAGTWPACTLIGNQTGDPFVFRPALNPLSLTSHGNIKYFNIFLIFNNFKY